LKLVVLQLERLLEPELVVLAQELLERVLVQQLELAQQQAQRLLLDLRRPEVLQLVVQREREQRQVLVQQQVRQVV
jgi:hypothetical protein